MGSEQHRFPQHEQRKRWEGCFEVLSCFKSQKGGKRIVPASRIPEGGNASSSQPNGTHQADQATGGVNLSLLAPPSSPASFTNSALPSTAQSPNNCYLSLAANSPGGPSSSMYATGPYAHETQLVSPPPVFSTFTTEPSTAPFTPPPELAHLTTPSSPDVPYARFLTSKNSGKGHYNDLHSTYSLYPGSPASSLRSPISRASGDGLLSPQTGVSTPLQESNFFCPETFAKFYLDHDPQNGGRLSVSKDSDTSQNRQTRSPKRDMEELEAYRASFGFSADEVITTSQYVEITDVMDHSLLSPRDGQKLLRREANLLSQTSPKSEAGVDPPKSSSNGYKDHKPRNGIHADEEALLSRVGSVKGSRSYPTGFSSSDAEIEYRRGRSLREGRENRRRR
ncbi:unnamed protein product [Brassica oleracea var. botrytis]|uniref:Hydroxyproline-rich glycoprotein family protein n=3 Tax=Brassica TaxID=3705 RepID=A0A0D3CWB2_BRAOL|nr:PREDICTED: uncharacterized protein At1g76660-like [Brassica oleracea var. oleracea]XP_013648734.2 uncharacterized protein At1g76660-like [Brassica napus]KAH0874613.1 hypothetical protein HID58_071975 [Brassica napus]CAF2060807.1 unnamed protein product [Brassica napus]VDD62859.1 unnamed protein product [Brassica oleracea]